MSLLMTILRAQGTALSSTTAPPGAVMDSTRSVAFAVEVSVRAPRVRAPSVSYPTALSAASIQAQGAAASAMPPEQRRAFAGAVVASAAPAASAPAAGSGLGAGRAGAGREAGEGAPSSSRAPLRASQALAGKEPARALLQPACGTVLPRSPRLASLEWRDAARVCASGMILRRVIALSGAICHDLAPSVENRQILHCHFRKRSAISST
jgi:hypothetical protein